MYNEELLNFKQIKFYYIYPFIFDPNGCFDSNEIRDKINLGIPETRAGWLPTYIYQGLFANNSWFYLKTENLKFKISKKKINWNIEILSKDKSDIILAQMSILVRLRRSGIGTITFEISHQKNGLISYYDLHPFLRLVPRTWFHLSENKISELSRTKEYLSKIRLKEKSFSLCKIFIEILSTLERELKLKKLEDFYKDYMSLEILEDLKYGILTKENSSKSLDSILNCDTIHPFLYIEGKLTEEDYNKSFLETEIDRSSIYTLANRQKFIKQIAALLFRFFDLTHYQYLSMEYIIKELNLIQNHINILVSDNLNSKFFSHVYRMGAIGFYSYEGIPYEMISKSIVDLLENGRAKWFGLAFANILMDEIIYNLKSVYMKGIERFGNILRIMVPIERLIALSIADPNVYLYDGHVAFDAIELIHDRLLVDELYNIVTSKYNMFSNLLKNSYSTEYFDFIDMKEKELHDRKKES